MKTAPPKKTNKTNLIANNLYLCLDSSREESPSGSVADVLNCDIVVNDFEIQSWYYVYFRANALGKRMTSFIPSPL